MSRLRAFFNSQAQFDAWAAATRPRNVYAAGLALLFVAAACTFAIAVMGPRLVREGTLLWFGTYAEGTVREIKLEEAGTFKGSAPRYRLAIVYRFVAADAPPAPPHFTANCCSTSRTKQLAPIGRRSSLKS